LFIFVDISNGELKLPAAPVLRAGISTKFRQVTDAPKPPFYNLFEALKHMPDNKVIIFRPGTKQKETGPGITREPDYAMVETGEGRIPPTHIAKLVQKRKIFAVSFCGRM
jgi:hypothetical protein